MSSYIRSTCPNCRRTLNIRAVYLGRWVTCNRCEHSFLARPGDATTVPASSDGPADVDGRVANGRAARLDPFDPGMAGASPALDRPRDGGPSCAILPGCPGPGGETPDEVERLLDQVRALQRRAERAEALVDRLSQVEANGSGGTEAALEVLRQELAMQFQEELSAMRAESDEAIGELQRERDELRAERDRFAEDYSRAVASIRAIEEDHRKRLDAIVAHGHGQGQC